MVEGLRKELEIISTMVNEGKHQEAARRLAAWRGRIGGNVNAAIENFAKDWQEIASILRTLDAALKSKSSKAALSIISSLGSKRARMTERAADMRAYMLELGAEPF